MNNLCENPEILNDQFKFTEIYSIPNYKLNYNKPFFLEGIMKSMGF